MNGFLDARRRYTALLSELESDSDLDRDLHDELMRTIRMLDAKIEEAAAATLTPCAQPAAAPEPARRRRNAR